MHVDLSSCLLTPLMSLPKTQVFETQMCVYENLVVYTLNPLRIVFGFREGMQALDPAVMKIKKCTCTCLNRSWTVYTLF